MEDLQKFLGLIVYAPALVANDSRPLAAIHGMERAQPGRRLEWTISGEGQFISLPQRDAWIVQGTKDGGFPLICNGDEGSLVTIQGLANSARFSPGGRAQFEVHAHLPLSAINLAVAGDILEGVGDGARAFWGHVTPDGAALDIARQTSPSEVRAPGPSRGLPVLRLTEDLCSFATPQYLGWLNYWSDDAARAIGFPDPERDAELLARSRRTVSGGWIVRLTEEPLELDNPAHLTALKRAYERFPEIGGRATPRPRPIP